MEANHTHNPTKTEMLKKIFVYVQGGAYMLAGINHFWHPSFYTKMVESFLPYPLELVYISGIAELLLGLGLMIPATRRYSAFGIVFMLISFFPVHISMAMHPDNWPDVPAWGLYTRIALQFVLIYLANIYTTPANAKMVPKEKAAH